MADIKLYLVRYDEQPYYVEAASMAEAIEIWREDRLAQPKEYGWDGDEEPEEVALVHYEPVIRRK